MFQLFQFGIRPSAIRSERGCASYPTAVNDTNEIYGSVFHFIHPADDINSIISRYEKAINDDRIAIHLDPNAINYPARIANYSSESMTFQVIANSALEVFKDGKIIPQPMGGPGYDWGQFTDGGKYYWNLTNNVYRFSPMRMKKHEYGRDSMYDGYYEKISVENYNNVSQFLFLLQEMFPINSVNIKNEVTFHYIIYIKYYILISGCRILSQTH